MPNGIHHAELNAGPSPNDWPLAELNADHSLTGGLLLS